MPSNVKVSKVFQSFPQWERLKHGFEQHIIGNTPDFFGRDVPYDHYNTSPMVREFLHHIHICVPIDDHPTRWSYESDIIRRTNQRNQPDKDFALVYCYDDMNDIYYLLTIIGPDAHNMKIWAGMLRTTAITAESILLGRREGPLG